VNSRLGDKDGPKDANDALLRGYDICEIIKERTINLGDVNLLTLGDLKDKVIHRIVN
jgi:hypothetical protein